MWSFILPHKQNKLSQIKLEIKLEIISYFIFEMVILASEYQSIDIFFLMVKLEQPFYFSSAKSMLFYLWLTSNKCRMWALEMEDD